MCDAVSSTAHSLLVRIADPADTNQAQTYFIKQSSVIDKYHHVIGGTPFNRCEECWARAAHLADGTHGLAALIRARPEDIR